MVARAARASSFLLAACALLASVATSVDAACNNTFFMFPTVK